MRLTDRLINKLLGCVKNGLRDVERECCTAVG